MVFCLGSPSKDKIVAKILIYEACILLPTLSTPVPSRKLGFQILQLADKTAWWHPEGAGHDDLRHLPLALDVEASSVMGGGLNFPKA